MVSLDKIKQKYMVKDEKALLEIAKMFGIEVPEDANLLLWILQFYDNSIEILNIDDGVRYSIEVDDERYTIGTYHSDYFTGRTYNQRTGNLFAKSASFLLDNQDKVVFTEETGYEEGNCLSLYKLTKSECRVTDSPILKVKVNQKNSTKWMNFKNTDQQFKEEVIKCFDNSYYYSVSRQIDELDNNLVTVESAFSIKKHHTNTKLSNSELLNKLGKNPYCGFEIVKTVESLDRNSELKTSISFSLIKTNHTMNVEVKLGEDSLVSVILLSNEKDIMTFADLDVLIFTLKEYRLFDVLDKDIIIQILTRFKRFIFEQDGEYKRRDYLSSLLDDYKDFEHTCFEIYSNIDKVQLELQELEGQDELLKKQ